MTEKAGNHRGNGIPVGDNGSHRKRGSVIYNLICIDNLQI